MVKIIDPTRTCEICKGHVTDAHYQRGTPVWTKSKYGTGLWCKPCYDHWRLKQPKAKAQKRVYMNKYRNIPDVYKRNLEYQERYRKDSSKKLIRQAGQKNLFDRSLRYRGKSVFFGVPVRTGVCNWCRAVIGFDTDLTSLHHDEDRYDDEYPLRYTIELCNSCHSTETNRLTYQKKLKIYGEFRCRRCNSNKTRPNRNGVGKWLFNKYGFEILCARCYDHFRNTSDEYKRSRNRLRPY